MRLFLLFALATLLPAMSYANQDLPVVKLKCNGDIWIDGQKYELKDGFIDLNKTNVQVSGFGRPDGKYEVIPKSVREESLAIRSLNKPLVIASLNRLSGRTNFYEHHPSGDIKDGKMLFIGDCQKAKPLF